MKKLTNKIIDYRLSDRQIERVDDYQDSTTKITWICLICKYKWMAKPNSVLLSIHGCPKCAKLLPLTNEIIDSKIEYRNIKRLDDCINSSTKIRWQCIICNYIWLTKPNAIFTGTGCARCSKRIKLSNDIIDERINQIGSKIIRIGNYINSLTKIQF